MRARRTPPDTSFGVADISTRADCERLVRAFYSRALTDPIIGWIFTDVAKLDVEAHVPQIASFWETILLGAQTYRGGAFRPHAALHLQVRLRSGHFERWLVLWRETVDELFEGERAELAKAHAQRVARAFHSRLEELDAMPPVSGIVVTRHGRGEPLDRLARMRDGVPAVELLVGDVVARAAQPPDHGAAAAIDRQHGIRDPVADEDPRAPERLRRGDVAAARTPAMCVTRSPLAKPERQRVGRAIREAAEDDPPRVDRAGREHALERAVQPCHVGAEPGARLVPGRARPTAGRAGRLRLIQKS